MEIKKIEATETTALATRTLSMEEVEVHSIAEAKELGFMIFKSGIFKNVPSPEAGAMMLLKARSLGQSGFWGLDNLHVVEGQLGIKADAVLALVLQDLTCEYLEWVESTDDHATLAGKRRGRPEFRYTYTIEDAKRALLLDRGDTDDKKAKSNWNRYRKNMLRARCVTDVARMYFPYATKGMKSVEELHDERTIDIDPNTGEVLKPGETQSAQTPPKDWTKEVEALRAKVEAAATGEDFRNVRKTLDEVKDCPAELLNPVFQLYNERGEAAKQAAKAKRAPAATP